MEAAVNEAPHHLLDCLISQDNQLFGQGRLVEVEAADATLFALAPALEAAATPYLACNMDLDVAPDHPAHAEAVATKRQLLAKVQDVAERIFQHQPETLAGVLLTAHAAAVTTESAWDGDLTKVSADGLLLRLVANSLFRVAGVDWRGRALEDVSAVRAEPRPALVAGADMSLAVAAADLNRLDAEIAALGARFPELEYMEIEAVPALENRRDEVLRDLCRVEAQGASGLVAKARALRTRTLSEDGVRHGELAVSLARDVERLATPGGMTPVSLAEVATPASATVTPELAAMVADWLAVKPIADKATSLEDPEIDRKFDLQRQILAQPCAGLADLQAKVPLFREELDAATAGLTARQLATDLPFTAWQAVIRDLGALSGNSGRAHVAAPDPIFEAIDTYRSAHAILVASLAEPGDADDDLIERSDLAFEALLAARPTTEAGRLAHLQQVVFEFAYTGRGCSLSPEWVADAGRLVNGGLPVRRDSLSPLAIEPMAADRALHGAIEAHFMAYAHRLHSECYGQADATASVERELSAFRRLLHSPLGTDAGRVAYATAVLGRAVGAHPDELQGEGRTAPLAVAYRNLAHGQFWREDENMRPIAAE